MVMVASEVWAVAHRAFMYTRHNRGFVGSPRFVEDAKVNYSPELRKAVVKRQDLFDIDDSQRWVPFLEPRPTWVNVSFLLDDGDVAVFTLEKSRDVMAVDDTRPNAINVSGPPEWPVEFE